ncbi:MAG: 3-phosphoshikimate 1-carboxyvinyltransferase [Rhodobacterales bacterium]|nr:3-phosphoshikimate 1-carboxyvinyltransferase [Rhodobacterales bacterium]
MRVHIEPAGALVGEVEIPGDKSVSHRSLLFNAMAAGPARVTGLLRSGDVAATANALRALGVGIDERPGEVIVTPKAGLVSPSQPLDCGNSGTTIRLLSGWLAAHPLYTVLVGDDSLSKRPMRRVTGPLRAMGAQIDGRDDGNLSPLTVRGGTVRPGTRHDLNIASAQVKSAILLAGRNVGVSVREPRQSRDHTERMLIAMGADLSRDVEGWWNLQPVTTLEPLDVAVPRDLSAAAFWLVAGSIIPDSELRLPTVGINPARAGVLDALKRMGADIQIEPLDAPGAEPIANIVVRCTQLHGATIDGNLALRCLDELPVLAVAAACADGVTTIRDASELRVKESDRISRVVGGLRTLGVRVEELPDGMVITGGNLRGPGHVDAHGDHRIAMAFAVAGRRVPGGVVIDNADAVTSSYPNFFDQLHGLGGTS